ncbi:hypothetical protein DAEQUDRAFT_640236, partial [Daedalea quercina L-15889]
GQYGTGASADEITEYTGVSVGSIYNCARRCMITIMGLHGESIKGEQDCAEMKSGTSAWGGGIYAADGTPVKLFAKPGFFGLDLYGKDKIYAIQLTLIILIHNLLIADYAVGQPGSVHDSAAFKETYFCNNYEQLLQRYQWIWADSAYTLTPWLITPFKAPRGKQLTRNQERFNYYLSRIRVAVEHTIGLLKARWGSLKELQIQITDGVKLAYATMWIHCCLVLHILVIK